MTRSSLGGLCCNGLPRRGVRAVEGARLEIAWVPKGASRVQIPPSPSQGCKRRRQSRRRAAGRLLAWPCASSVEDAGDECLALQHLLRGTGEADVVARVLREEHLVAGSDTLRL